jgi:spore coat protein U-like protein
MKASTKQCAHDSRTRKSRRRLLAPVLALSGFFVAPKADALTASTTMNVTATVLSTCSVSATDLAFGNYNPISGANLDGATSISVTCTNGTGYNVGISAGGGTGATVASRKMTNGANTLNYTLYRDAGRTNVWGVTIATDTLIGTGSGAAQPIDVYGRVPGSQAAPSGGYTDTVTITVTY